MSKRSNRSRESRFPIRRSDKDKSREEAAEALGSDVDSLRLGGKANQGDGRHSEPQEFDSDVPLDVIIHD